MTTTAPANQAHALASAFTHAASFNPDFPEWLRDNLHVWRAFEWHAMLVCKRGFKHYSARTIVEVMRHESATRERGGDDYKLNNNNVPDLARLYLLMHPENAGLFNLRDQRNTQMEAA